MSISKGKIAKSEKITIGILVAAALVFAGFWAYGEIRKAHAEAQVQSFQQENQTTFSMGETMHLDAEEDAQAVGPDGYPFQANFAWQKGAMDVVIDSATLYDSSKDAGIPDEAISFGSALTKPFLLVKATFKNIDAQPGIFEDGELIDNENGLYNISFLEIPSGELCYFDGTSPKADEKGGYNFELDPGEQKQFTLGFCVHEEDQFNNVLDIGVVPGKYWVYLDIDDKRKGAEK